MSVAYTVGSTNWTEVDKANELWTACKERGLFSDAAIAAGFDLQSASGYFGKMQQAVETAVSYSASRNKGWLPDDTSPSGSHFPFYNSVTDFRTDVGLNVNGFTRVKDNGSTDYGIIQAGDYIGAWLIDELIDCLDKLKFIVYLWGVDSQLVLNSPYQASGVGTKQSSDMYDSKCNEALTAQAAAWSSVSFGSDLYYAYIYGRTQYIAGGPPYWSTRFEGRKYNAKLRWYHSGDLFGSSSFTYRCYVKPSCPSGTFLDIDSVGLVNGDYFEVFDIDESSTSPGSMYSSVFYDLNANPVPIHLSCDATDPATINSVTINLSDPLNCIFCRRWDYTYAK